MAEPTVVNPPPQTTAQSQSSGSSRGRGNRARGRRRPPPQAQQHPVSIQHDIAGHGASNSTAGQSQSLTGGRGNRQRTRRGRGDHVQSNDSRQSTATHQNGSRLDSVTSNPHLETADQSQQTQGAHHGVSHNTTRLRRRGQASRTQHAGSARVAGIRQFGGQLTRNDSVATVDGAELNAGATAFTPGAAMNASVAQSTSRTFRQKQRISPSTAPDISTRIHEDINNKVYECSICTNTISRRDKVWSCHTCWSVLHLKCVKQWSSKSLAAENSTNSVSSARPQTWRCPGCNLPKEEKPGNFNCWCSKETDPTSLPGLPPFSCGQTCNRSRACPHPCSTTCHAGPCEPCRQMGPSQSCFCGREDKTRKCLETDYVHGWSCGQVCNEMMPCGEHYCGRPCHEGLCGACEVPVEARCYCGQEETVILCCDKGDELESTRDARPEGEDTVVDRWMGTFDCGNLCGRVFDCGKHHCEKQCHSQEQDTPHCPRSPDVVTQCPCGKTALMTIMPAARTSCEDEIALCDKACGKSLPCGHACSRVCHAGDCYPCLSMTDISCRCGKTTTTTMCHQGELEPPSCLRICRAMLNCARHECGEHCCSGERKAADRIASRKKMSRILNSPLGPELNFEAEHICTRTCDRALKCGNHSCPDLCHRGPCSSCREAIFEEISCHCGKTVLQPPLPCGTQPPPCRFDCERNKACGHPQVSHPCHADNEICPKCPFLTTKPCLCGKNKLKNQPCGTDLVLCGEVCGKKLKCGWHTCRKGCHRSGECEDATTPCSQACGKEKTCGHSCSAKCHSPFLCKEDTPCEHKMFVTCTCQRIKQEARCNATKHHVGNTEKTLTCDDECARLERNRKLQLALNIPADHQDDHVPYSADTINMYLSNPIWSSLQEKTMRVFAADPDQRRLRFKPMKRPQRAFIHALSQDFGFDSESIDPEPHRHVALFKTPKFVMAPMKLLSDCVRIRQSQATAVAATATKMPLMAKERNITRTSKISNEPFNALLLTNARFGLTTDELRRACISAGVTDDLIITFLLSEEVVIQPSAATTSPSSTILSSFKALVQKAASSQHLGSVQECRVDSSLNVERREADELDGPDGNTANGNGADGWSQVAKAAGVPGRKLATARPIESKSSFVVLGSQSRRKQKQKVVDNWDDDDDVEEGEQEHDEQQQQQQQQQQAEHTGQVEQAADGDEQAKDNEAEAEAC